MPNVFSIRYNVIVKVQWHFDLTKWTPHVKIVSYLIKRHGTCTYICNASLQLKKGTQMILRYQTIFPLIWHLSYTNYQTCGTRRQRECVFQCYYSIVPFSLSIRVHTDATRTVKRIRSLLMLMPCSWNGLFKRRSQYTTMSKHSYTFPQVDVRELSYHHVVTCYPHRSSRGGREETFWEYATAL